MTHHSSGFKYISDKSHSKTILSEELWAVLESNDWLLCNQQLSDRFSVTSLEYLNIYLSCCWLSDLYRYLHKPRCLLKTCCMITYYQWKPQCCMLSIYDLLVPEHNTDSLFCKVRHICAVMHAGSITMVYRTRRTRAVGIINPSSCGITRLSVCLRIDMWWIVPRTPDMKCLLQPFSRSWVRRFRHVTPVEWLPGRDVTWWQ